MQSSASTVEEYLAELPDDRRQAISVVREAILNALPEGYEEGMQYGMIGYYVPHSIYPKGYHCDPRVALPYAGLASQKNYMAVYVPGVYGNDEESKAFVEAYKATGKKLDMGKVCVRFKKLEDLALDVVVNQIAKRSVDQHVAEYEAILTKHNIKHKKLK